MEKWDVLDANGLQTGRRVERGVSCLSAGEYHLVVHIWIISKTGKMLIQRRSKRKKYMPGEWAATGGAAIAGEDSVSAARRELNEELGIALPESAFSLCRRFRRRNSFVDIWMVRCDKRVSDLHLQRSEVSQARWISAAELSEMINSGDYHNYGADYFDAVFSAAAQITEGIKND